MANEPEHDKNRRTTGKDDVKNATVTPSEKRGTHEDEELVPSSHPDAANERPREPDPSVAHPQPDDGMDSVLVDPDQIVSNDDERGTEHRP